MCSDRAALRRLALFLTLTASSVVASAQTVTQLAPLPSRWGFSGAHFLDAQTGFLCGGRKGLCRTLDGGQNWTTIPLPGFQGDPLYNVTFLDANVGIVCGNSSGLGPDVYRTTDGGTTWSQVTAFPLGGSWYFQDYVSASTGFAGCNGAIVRTTDAGATWQLRSGYPNCPVMTGMDFADANVGFASGGLPNYTTGVFKTSDGGLSWTVKLARASDDVIYLSPGVLLAATIDGIFRSDDGGDTWYFTGAIVPTGMVDVDNADANTAVGVSGKGDIWRTADGGFSWNQVWVGEGDLPSDWSVKFTTPLTGTVVGGPASAYITHDGGLTWTRLNHGANFNAYALAVLGSDTLVTAGHHGYVQTMPEVGPWNLFLIDPPSFGRDTSYSALSAVGADFIYAVGHWGALARSVDGGRHWQNLAGSVGIDYYANDVKFTDRQTGWMTGWDYGMFPQNTRVTHDGGLSWQALADGTLAGVAIDVIGPMIWIQSGGRAHWRSGDGGDTFATGEVPYNSGSSPSVTDMSFADPSLGYVCGYDGYLARTLDGGATWAQIGGMEINKHYLGVLAHRDELWVCGGPSGGGNAFIKRSLDQGLTWRTWAVGGLYSAPLRMVRAGARLYVSGDRGEIWRIDGLPNVNARGDMDCNGTVNAFDVQGFVTALRDPAAYAGQYPGCDIRHADTNADGTVNPFDVQGFVDLLMGP